MTGNSTGGESRLLGPRLHALRLRAGLSQQEAAARAGISTRALRDVEHGRVLRPQPRTLRRLAEALDLSGAEVDELVSAGLDGPAAPSPALRVLGTFTVLRAETPVPLTSPMLHRLLSLLALKHPAPATTDEIVDTLWPDGPPRSQQSLTHTYISQARQVLATAAPKTGVLHTPSGYRLDAPWSLLDLGHFDRSFLQARSLRVKGDPERDAAALDALSAALRWWRGPMLADAGAELRRHPAAVAANVRRIEAAMLHADLALALGRTEESVKVLRDMVHDEPLHEGLQARLILCLAARGEQVAALQQFAGFRERLDDELGIAPGAELNEAYVRVLRHEVPVPRATVSQQQVAAAPAAAQPQARDATSATLVRPAQLPARAGGYVGRERQLRELDALIEPDPARRAAIIAVVGGPGVGKTALAVQWAHERRGHFPDGQLFADLRGHSPTPAMRPAEVIARFLRTLGVPQDRLPADLDEATAMYRTLLADRRMLIVLDNARDADHVRPLIPGAQGCALLITSRTRMAGLIVSDGAGRLDLDMLDPGESRRLFERIAGEERVAAEPEAAERLARLCGGLPLAIRIAAANLLVRRIGLADYCAELTAEDSGAGLLSRLRVDGDQRSTIRLAFELSYRALPEPARRVFRLLSLTPGADVTVHASGALADLTAAEAETELKVLAESNLLEERGSWRFGMHDLLRTYARELTAADAHESRVAQERLYDWYLCHTEAAAQLLCPPDTAPGSRPPAGLPPSPLFPTHAQAGEWLEGERENLVGAVLQAARSGFPRAAWQIAEHLHGFLYQGAYTVDCLEVAAAGLSAAEADGDLRAQAAARLRYGESHWALGENALALRQYAAAQDLAGQAGWHAGRALAMRRIGAAHQENGAMSLAFEFLSQARELADQTDRVGAAEDLTNLGLICWKLGRLAEAAAHFTAAAQVYQELDDRRAVAIARTNLGIAYRAMGRPRDTIRVIGQALSVHVGNGNKVSEAVALNCLAGAHTDLGDPDAGARLAQAGIEAARALGQRRLEANALIALGAAREKAGQLAAAAESYRASMELAELVGDRFPQVAALIGEAIVLTRLEKYDSALANAHRAAAMAGSAEFRVQEGCALDVVADVSLRRGQFEAAIETANTALELHRSTGHLPGELRCHRILADAYAALGREDAAAEHRRETARSRLAEPRRGVRALSAEA